MLFVFSLGLVRRHNEMKTVLFFLHDLWFILSLSLSLAPTWFYDCTLSRASHDECAML
jgi:hypothetical protein